MEPEVQVTPSDGSEVTAEFLSAVLNVTPGNTPQEKSQRLLFFSSLYLASFFAGMPEDIRGQAEIDMLNMIHSMTADILSEQLEHPEQD